MDILRRAYAPIPEEAWREIDDLARDVLSAHLAARRFVDVSAPMGWDYSAVPLGRVNVTAPRDEQGFSYGIRQCMPMVETRAVFSLERWELDNISRGAKDPDLDPVEVAARRVAKFEETAILEGFKDASIVGMYEAAEQTVPFSKDPEKLPAVVSDAVTVMADQSIQGPFALVLNSSEWKLLAQHVKGYPVRRYLEDLIGGPIIFGQDLTDGLLVSLRGGDLELVLGQDFSVGFESADTKKVTFFITESFTFRIIEPRAYVKLAIQ